MASVTTIKKEKPSKAKVQPQIQAAPSEISILVGYQELFDHVDPNGEMWDGEGERDVRVRVEFDTPLERAPHVFLSVVQLDSSQAQNLRFQLLADSITNDGFDTVFRTWSDTRLASCLVQWMAMSQSVDSRFRMIMGNLE